MILLHICFYNNPSVINAKLLLSIQLPIRLLSTLIFRGRSKKRLISIHNIQIFLEFSSQKGRGWERKLSYWLPINTFAVILSPSLFIAFVGLLYVFNRCMTWVLWAWVHSGVVATPSSPRHGIPWVSGVKTHNQLFSRRLWYPHLKSGCLTHQLLPYYHYSHALICGK